MPLFKTQRRYLESAAWENPSFSSIKCSHGSPRGWNCYCRSDLVPGDSNSVWYDGRGALRKPQNCRQMALFSWMPEPDLRFCWWIKATKMVMSTNQIVIHGIQRLPLRLEESVGSFFDGLRERHLGFLRATQEQRLQCGYTSTILCIYIIYNYIYIIYNPVTHKKIYRIC